MAARKAFHVSAAAALAGAAIHRFAGLWTALGNLETRVLAESLRTTSIDRPIYIAGLARSGSTILLECIASLSGVVTHRYRDFPPLFTPYCWNWFLDRAGESRAPAAERAHKDRIKVTRESPEAMEEPLWMAFFEHLHDPRVSNILDAGISNPPFEQFYRDHVRKLLLMRAGRRYASKGNYNVSRMEYLLHLFPQARFLIPVREPAAHIASLMKQHGLFTESTRDNARARAHLRQVGHFEFGPDRCPINTGDDAVSRQVLDLWRDGDEVRGWAAYWSAVYGYVARRLDASPALKRAALVVRYEDLCASPGENIDRIMTHCELEDTTGAAARFSERLSLPGYYQWPFSDDDLASIREHTGAVAGAFGYD